MAKIGLPKGSGKRLKVREKSVKSQGILKWILSGNPDACFVLFDHRLLRKDNAGIFGPLSQLHAWWHILAGSGTYLSLVFM